MTHLKSQKQNSHSAEGVEKDEHLNKFLQQRKSSDCAEETHEQQPEGEQSSAGGSAASPMSSSPQPFSPVSSSSVLPSNSPLQQVNGGASCQCLLVVANTQSGKSLNESKFSPLWNTHSDIHVSILLCNVSHSTAFISV